MSENGTLSRKQRRALAALLASGSVDQAAQSAHCGRSTLYRWLAQAAFRDELRTAQNEALGTVTARLVALLGRSLDTLAGDLDSGGARASRAALGILSRFADLAQYLDLEARVAELEQREANHAQPIE